MQSTICPLTFLDTLFDINDPLEGWVELPLPTPTRFISDMLCSIIEVPHRAPIRFPPANTSPSFQRLLSRRAALAYKPASFVDSNQSLLT